MPTPVTDPDILSQLGGGGQPSGSSSLVTDQDTLNQLNDGTSMVHSVVPGKVISDVAGTDDANRPLFKGPNGLQPIDPTKHTTQWNPDLKRYQVHELDQASHPYDWHQDSLAGRALSAFNVPNLVKGAVNTVKSAVNLPSDVAEGRVEPGDYSRAMDVATLASPGSAGRAPRTAVAKAATPSVEELSAAADNNYKNARGMGVEIHPRAVNNLADEISAGLETAGYDPDITPKTFKAVEKLRREQPSTISNIENVRKKLNRIGADYTESDATRRAKNSIDEFMTKLTENDITNNPHFLEPLKNEMEQARGNYAAASRAKTLDTAEVAAEDRAGASGSGANVNNLIRAELRKMLGNRKALRGYSDAEKAMMRKAVRGTPYSNAMRLMGKAAPTGIIPAVLSGGLGHMVAGPFGAVVPAAGTVAKYLGDRATKQEIAGLNEFVRSNSPLAEASPSVPQARRQMPYVPPGLYAEPELDHKRGGAVKKALRIAAKH